MLSSTSSLFNKIFPASVSGPIRRALHSGRMDGPFDRNEEVAFILETMGLHEEATMLRFSPSETSYRGAADFLLAKGRYAAAEHGKSYENSLKAMLLIKNMSNDSTSIVERALKQLSESPDVADQIAALRHRALNPVISPIEFREAVEAIANTT